jgi:hypothetical protein
LGTTTLLDAMTGSAKVLIEERVVNSTPGFEVERIGVGRFDINLNAAVSSSYK